MHLSLYNLRATSDINMSDNCANMSAKIKTCFNSVSVYTIQNDIMLSISNNYPLYSDAYLLTMDMLHEIGIHHTLPRSPCFSINLNSFLVATLNNILYFFIQNCDDHSYLCFYQWSVIRKHGPQSLAQSPEKQIIYVEKSNWLLHYFNLGFT